MAVPTPLKRLSVMAGQKGLSDLHIPTITDDAEDVVGLQGRIRLQKDDRVATSQWMDKQRNNLLAYEYLCHIGEAKEWIEECLEEEIDPIIRLEESMRDGIVLANLACWFAPEVVHKNKIITDTKHKFLHSENINAFFKAIHVVGLPHIFMFELTDLYDKKNIPKVIYCIHALSHLLASRQLAPNIKNLYGQLQFTNEELSATQRTLDSYGVAMPNFTNIGSSLQKELGETDGEARHFKKIDFEPRIPFKTMTTTTPTSILEVEESDTDDEQVTSAPVIAMTNKASRPDSFWRQPVNKAKLETCQAAVRTWNARKEFKRVQQIHQSTLFQSRISMIQAHARGVLSRRAVEQKRVTFERSTEDWIVEFQAACRGFLERSNQYGVMEYSENVDHVVHVQGLLKNKVAEHSYRKLVTESNPSLGIVKNFIHLLDDSDLDFDQELKIEGRRKEVIELIRFNNQLDADLNAVDTKIALLVRNAITLDEVLKVSGVFRKKEFRRISQLTPNHAATQALSLRGIDKKSKTKLELYQQLVYLLQTEPQYLARLMSLTSAGGHERRDGTHRRIESSVLSLFGYATNTREEYLLINLCKFCIMEEIQYVESTQEFMRGNYTFMKLVVQTNRGAKEREFFRRLLKPLVEEVVRNEFLDLETDPIGIYHKAINDEELRTGLPSQRKRNVNSQEALADREVRDTFILHLRNLREITERFLSGITSTIDEMPYGIRAVARELRLVLTERFTEEPPESIVKILGHFIYYRYLNPAIIAPEQYDVIDESINPIQRKNLAEVSKMLQQISSGKVFDVNDMFLAPLNDYVFDAGQRFAKWFLTLTDVDDPQEYFGMDALGDHARTQKPVVYISLRELYYLHAVVENNAEELVPQGRGLLFDILNELGESPFNQGVEIPEQTLCLNLTNRREDLPQDADARLQQLLVDTKRLVVYVVRVQSGPTLREILDEEANEDHERLWSQVKQEQFVDAQSSIATKRRHVTLGQNGEPLDLHSINFRQLKKIADRLVKHLEQFHILEDSQDIIRQVARDIVGKKTRRQKRETELKKLDETLKHLRAKRDYLEETRQGYNDYLQASMTTMASKRNKRQRFVLPFSRQYFHMRRLEQQGLVPRFGSYKYTVKQLYDRGIIVDLQGVSNRLYDSIPLVLSMDKPGVISIEVKSSLINLSMDLQYEELLQVQYEGAQTYSLLDDHAKVNVNLLIYFINKKFYSS